MTRHGLDRVTIQHGRLFVRLVVSPSVEFYTTVSDSASTLCSDLKVGEIESAEQAWDMVLFGMSLFRSLGGGFRATRQIGGGDLTVVFVKASVTEWGWWFLLWF